MHRSRINGLLIDCKTDDIDAAGNGSLRVLVQIVHRIVLVAQVGAPLIAARGRRNSIPDIIERTFKLLTSSEE